MLAVAAIVYRSMMQWWPSFWFVCVQAAEKNLDFIQSPWAVTTGKPNDNINAKVKWKEKKTWIRFAASAQRAVDTRDYDDNDRFIDYNNVICLDACKWIQF